MKETVGHTVRHLAVAPVRVTWHKRRMVCVNLGCSRGGSVEDRPLAMRRRAGVAGRSVADADRQQGMPIDSAGSHGHPLGVVEGHTAPVADWISGQPAAWRAGMQAVTIDMSTVYLSAARTALPGAMIATGSTLPNWAAERRRRPSLGHLPTP